MYSKSVFQPGLLTLHARIHNECLPLPRNIWHTVYNTRHTIVCLDRAKKMDGGRVIICPALINTLWSQVQLESLTSPSDLSQHTWLTVGSTHF